MNDEKNIIWLILDFVILSLLLVDIYILITVPAANAYEVSVYNAFPIFFWIGLIFILALIIMQVIYYHRNKHLLLILLIGVDLLILLIPLFRGYFIYGRGDVLTHIGRAKDILYTGHIGKKNFYPILHILIAQLNLIVGSSLGRLTVYLPAFFWLMLLTWYNTFTKNFTRDRILVLGSVLGWCLFPLGYWHTSMVGNMFSYYFMFLILGAWFSNIEKTKKYIVIFISYLMMVYFHPLTSIYLLGILALNDILTWIYKKVHGIPYSTYFMPRMGMIMLGIWFMWYLSFPKIQTSFRLFWVSMVSPHGNPFLNVYTSTVHRYNLPLNVLIKFALYRYAGVIWVSVLASIFILGYFFLGRYKTGWKRTTELKVRKIMFLGLLFITFGIWSGLNSFLTFVNFERSLRYVVAFGLPLAVYVWFSLLHKKARRSALWRVTLVAVIFLLSYLAVFTVHRSPLSGSLNMQVTASEYYGMGWWFTDRNISIIGYDDGQITQYRFYQAWYGRSKVFKAKNILFYGRGYDLIPQDFGYGNYSYVGGLFHKSHYFIIGRAMWKFYESTIPNREQYWRWKPQEYIRLKCDPTVYHIYSSTDVQVYYVAPQSFSKRE